MEVLVAILIAVIVVISSLEILVDISINLKVRRANVQKGSLQQGAELSISRERIVSSDCSVRERTSQPVYSHSSLLAVLVNAYKFAPVLYHYGEAYFHDDA